MTDIAVKVQHVCTRGHWFRADMIVDETGELHYAPFSNNLCSQTDEDGGCDRIGFITDNEVLIIESAQHKKQYFLRGRIKL